MTRLNALWLLSMWAWFGCAMLRDTGRPSHSALSAMRVGTSHVVDSSGDVWLVGGFTSDERGLLVVASCSNASGVCSGRTDSLVPLSDVVEVRP